MMTQVMDQIYKIELPIPFPLKSINAFYIADRPRTLIDTGIKTEASFEALQKGLEAHGRSLDSIERILITHGHIDHYGQAKRIASLSGARIYIHPIEYGRIRSIIHTFGALRQILLQNGAPEAMVKEAVHYIESAQAMADPLEEAFFLEDGDTIPFDSMIWKAIHCPGHSPGLLCFYWAEGKILFTGDHLLKEITPNPILNIPKEGPPFEYSSLKSYLASLEKIATLDVSLLLPGHGEEIDDLKGLIQKMFTHHRERADHIFSILSKGAKTAFEISCELFPGVLPFEVFLGISEVLGHLEILRQRGMIQRREEDGKDRYALLSY